MTVKIQHPNSLKKYKKNQKEKIIKNLNLFNKQKNKSHKICFM